ncbi:hypothetical protein [Bacillus pseudomycoides]|uniref:hypothetical protein n=1 Tax=Bacillus pseudomycoides TaxID=64104 RepID=UPI000BF8E048|nr:hypothetical protein [Bacillus pseudomycoides]PGA76454.1 hypothetical protein COL87_01135 [Bacillus pseudomycoides]PHE92373.1 hypothetical protein COF78_17420 [Bacillus pseudomycoides]
MVNLNFELKNLEKADPGMQEKIKASENWREAGNELPWLSCPSCHLMKCNCDLYVGVVCTRNFIVETYMIDDSVVDKTLFTKNTVYKARFKDGIYYTRDNYGTIHRFFEDFYSYFSEVLLENEVNQLVDNDTDIYAYQKRTLSAGERIYTVSPIKNGLIQIEPLSTGKIVAESNQLEAEVWMINVGTFEDDPITQALQLENRIPPKKVFLKNGSVSGVVLHLNEKDVAVEYRAEAHNGITIKEEDALALPLFTECKDKRVPSRKLRENEREFYYLLETVIHVMETNFKKWTENQNSESVIKKEQELELSFAKMTGVYYMFHQI